MPTNNLAESLNALTLALTQGRQWSDLQPQATELLAATVKFVRERSWRLLDKDAHTGKRVLALYHSFSSKQLPDVEVLIYADGMWIDTTTSAVVEAPDYYMPFPSWMLQQDAIPGGGEPSLDVLEGIKARSRDDILFLAADAAGVLADLQCAIGDRRTLLTLLEQQRNAGN